MAVVPITEMAAYEDDDTRLNFDVESDMPRYLSLVLQRTDQISQSKVNDEIVEQHIVIVDQMVHLLHRLQDSSSNINVYDKETLDSLSSAFSDVLSALQQCLVIASLFPTTVAKVVSLVNIPAEFLEDLLGLGFTCTRIAEMLAGSISLDYIKEDQRLWFRRFQVV